jgi:DNA polymerase-3 subunit beta
VYIYEDGDYLVFAATDSFRLAEKRIHIKKSVGFPPTLIPFKNAAEIVRVFEDVKEDIEILFSKTQISLSADGVRLVSRVIDGTFPDYKQIIPKEFKTEVVVLKQDIINANKLANIFSDSFNQMNIKADPEAKIFYVKTKNADIGENLNHIDAAVTGESVDVNFNYKYIVDCLQSIETDSLSLNFNGLSKPMIMKPIGDQSFIYLVMPMNR